MVSQTSKQFLKTSFFYTVALFIANILSYVFNVIVAKSSSLIDYGEYMSSVSHVFILIVPFTALSSLLVKKINQQDKNKFNYSQYLENSLVLFLKKNVLSIILLIFLFFFFYLKLFSFNLTTVIFILSYTFLNLFFNFYQGILQALKNFKLAAHSNLLFAGLKIILILGLYYLATYIEFVYLAIVLAIASASLIGYFFLHRVKNSQQSLKKITWRFFLTQDFLETTLTIIGITALINSDLIILNEKLPAEQASLYAGFSLLARTIFYALLPFINVAFAYINAHKKEAKTLIIISTLLLALISLFALLFYKFFPNFIVNLILDERYLTLSPILFLAAIFGALYSINYLFSLYFLSFNKNIAFITLFFAFLHIIILLICQINFQQVMLINIILNLILFFGFFLLLLVSHVQSSKK